MTKANEKFATVPVEDDTRILKQHALTVGHIDVLYQKWAWDGIIGESLIFLAADVAGATGNDVATLVKNNIEISIGESFTFKLTEDGYAFLNYA